jgi:hypothetical protein
MIDRIHLHYLAAHPGLNAHRGLHVRREPTHRNVSMPREASMRCDRSRIVSIFEEKIMISPIMIRPDHPIVDRSDRQNEC